MSDTEQGHNPAGKAAQVSELEKARRLLSASAIRALAADRWARHRPWLDWPALVLCVVVLAIVFVPPAPSVVPTWPLDSEAPETVRVERNAVVLNKEATRQRQERAEGGVLPVFSYDPEMYFRLTAQVRSAVSAMAERASAGSPEPALRRAAFVENLGQPVKPAVFALIEELAEPDDLTAALNFLLVTAIDRLVVGHRADIPASGGIEVRNLGTGTVRRLAVYPGLMEVEELRATMRQRSGDTPYGSAAVIRTWILDTAMAMARQNLVPDPAATMEQREMARATVEPLYARFATGQVLVHAGARVTAQVRERIALYNSAVEGRSTWGETVAFVLLFGGLVFLGGIFFRHGRRPLQVGRKPAYLTMTVAMATGFIAVIIYYAGRGIVDGLSLSPEAVPFLVPVALVTVLISLLVDSRTSLLAGIGLAVAMTYRVDGGLWLMTYYLVGVLAGGALARHCRRRSDLLKAGFLIGAVEALMVPVIVVLGGQQVGTGLITPMAFALVSGGMAALLATGLLPALEHVFDEATDMRLLELASSENPLLKELALRSPGTYYHSVMIGNLCEAAAVAIDANPLVCRVMALYHDIGKMRRPNYFAENQRGGNIHDRLPPELSARIIFAHIKDGIDLARKHRLGRVIVDAITQHQGTTLLRVFHAKAAERAAAEGKAVGDGEFRYPGPKPDSSEAGVLMLADSVEAATRALVNPSSAEVQSRVQQVIRDKTLDGQLDDCPLTVADLNRIEGAFVRVLTLGVYHNRIEYPPASAAGPYDEEQSHRNRDHDRGRNLGGRAS